MRFGKGFFVTSLILALLYGSAMWAQSAEPAFARDRQTRRDAVLSGDAKTYAKYTTDNFINIFNGGVTKKAEAVARIAAVKPPAGGRPPDPPHEDETIDVYGKTILLNWAQTAQGTKRLTTEIWVKQGGIWKCAGGHSSTVPAKKN